MKHFFGLLLLSLVFNGHAQDTFSIVAVDTVTGEVGSAGASCVDLYRANIPNADFIAHVLPGIGAINTQANYTPVNQMSATAKLLQGETPQEIIEWLQSNDATDQPQLRQYGIAVLKAKERTAAFTGIRTEGYQGHLVGATYSIQGNILSGPEVLHSMETRFLNTEGPLADKLMAALLGAKKIGADKRCALNGTSSLFAYINVAKPTDTFGSSSIHLTVRTRFGQGIEPIDELFRLYKTEEH